MGSSCARYQARSAGVPRPADTPGVCRVGVDISGDDVGLDPVASDTGRGPGMVDGIEHVEELRH
jgi:hypothetical protein